MRIATPLVLAVLAGLVLLPDASAILTPEGSTWTFRYLGGTEAPRRAFSIGGTCTASALPTVDDWERMPVVVGGVCYVPLAGAARVGISIVDDGWDALPILDSALPFSYSFWGADESGPTCTQGATAWGSIELAIPEGCNDVSVFLSELATTGTLTVRLS